MIRLILLIFTIFILLFPHESLSAQTDLQTFEYADTTRTFHVRVPDAQDQSEPLALLIALHPQMSNGRTMEAMTGLSGAAEDMIVAYPNSLRPYWNDGRIEAEVPIVLDPVDDVGFLLAFIEHLQETYAIDAERIYLLGDDSGGLMAFRMACQAPDVFAGIATVNVLMWKYHLQLSCATSDGMPDKMLLIHGTDDVGYPVNGRVFDPGNAQHRILSRRDTLAFWAERGGCSDGDPGFYEATVAHYSDCTDRTSLALYSVAGGDHLWPRGDDPVLNPLGVDATRMILDFFAADDLQAWAAPAVAADQAQDAETIPRSYRVYAPSDYDGETPLPMVIVLHGRPGNGLGIAYITDMTPVAEANGFIVVYPNGVEQGWNYLRGIAADFDTNGMDDDQFLRDLVADVSSYLAVDPTRIYLTGFSNGGFMTQRQACAAHDLFAAFAVVGATAYPNMYNMCEGQPPVPIMFIHGTEDVSVPWAGLGQRSSSGSTYYIAHPFPETVGFWLFHNGCDSEIGEAENLPQQGDSPGTQVIVTTFADCEDDHPPITVYVIDGGGHNWPGVPDMISEEIAGTVNMDFHASEVIWDYFATQELASTTED